MPDGESVVKIILYSQSSYGLYMLEGTLEQSKQKLSMIQVRANNNR